MGGALLLGFMAVERFPAHLGALPELTARRVIEGPVSHICDGDTIEVAGTPVRFGSLDCAERGTVRGDAATRCTSYDRSIGLCTLLDGRDVAAQMIRKGL